MGGSRKADGVGTDTEDNFEILARDELNKLCRQLRLMENDKRAYLKESNGALSHQQSILQNLRGENEKLENDLEQFINFNKERDTELYTQISHSTVTFHQLRVDFDGEKEISIKIKQKLKEVGERVEDLRLYAFQKDKEESSIPQLRNRICIVKRKLETVTAKFDSVVAENGKSRQLVDETLHENVAILAKCAQLEEEAEKQKNRICDLVDQATFAYDQREEAVGKTMAILEKNAKEKKQNLLEMSELARINRNDKKLLDFMGTKNKERHFLETNEDRMTRLELAKDKVTDEALESYIENFGTLLTEASPRISDLVEEYTDHYQKNIRRFEYINQLNKEIESLQKNVNDFRTKIRNCTLEIVERNQTKNKTILCLLTLLDEMTKSSQEAESNLGVIEISMQKILTSTTNLFHITSSSDNAHVLRLLGSSDEISPENLVLYMNIIEERIDEILGRDLVRNGSVSGNEIITSSRSKSPRPSSKTGSIFNAGRPSTPAIFQGLSDDLCHYELLDQEIGPVTYAKLRQKVRDASATTASTSSDESTSIVL